MAAAIMLKDAKLYFMFSQVAGLEVMCFRAKCFLGRAFMSKHGEIAVSHRRVIVKVLLSSK